MGIFASHITLMVDSSEFLQGLILDVGLSRPRPFPEPHV